MADYGIKMSKAGTAVTGTPTATTKKNFIVLSTDAVHKVSAQAVVSADTNVTHSLGFVPMFDSYKLSNSLTEARLARFEEGWNVSSDSTYLYCDETFGTDSMFYIIYADAP